MKTVRVPLTSDQRLALQAALFDPDIREIGLGGARGTAKTFGACAICLAYLMKYPGEWAVVLRRTERAAVANIRDEFYKVAELFDVPVRFNVSRAEFYLPNGSEFHIRHCAREADYREYQGLPYALIWFEEATQHQRMAYLLLGGSRRVRNPGTKPLRLATANPGEIGDRWFIERFVQDDTRPEGVLWIPSNLFQSLPTLERNPGYYDEVLSRLPRWKQLQWVEGRWDVLAGSYFDLHPRLIEEMTPPYWAKWYAGSDWGYWPDPFATVWFARWRDAEGHDHVHVALELGAYKLEPDLQAQRAVEFERKAFDDGYMLSPVRLRYADPQAWRRQEAESTEMGRTIASIWRRHGWVTLRAKTNARVPGWELLRIVMRPVYPDGRSVLTISPRCRALLNEIQYAVQEGAPDNITGHDIDPSCDDHYLSALRYGLVSTLGINYQIETLDPYQTTRPYSWTIRSKKRGVTIPRR